MQNTLILSSIVSMDTVKYSKVNMSISLHECGDNELIRIGDLKNVVRARI